MNGLLVALTAVSTLGIFVGKYGTLISLIAWVLGLIGVISAVSFWWVLGFSLTLVISGILTILGVGLMGAS